MEKFVDRIIETDRKAREIIEQAQQEKQAVLADAKKRADAEIARREAEADKGRAAIDEEFAQREARESERMDAAYLDAMRWTTPLRPGMTHGWPRSHKIRWPRCDARYA